MWNFLLDTSRGLSTYLHGVGGLPWTPKTLHQSPFQALASKEPTLLGMTPQ